jgi:integrase
MKRQKGYIFKKGGAWFLRFYDSIIQPDHTIKRKQRCSKLADVCDEFRNERQVRPLAEKILAPINSENYNPQSSMAVAEFITDIYLPKAKEESKPSTYKNYEDIFEIHVRPRVSGKILNKFRCVDAERLLADVARQDRNRSNQVLSHGTLERIKAFLSAVFKTAKRLGIIDGENPVRDSKVPAGTPKRKTHAYSLQEIAKILSVLPEPARTVCLCAAHTGLRKGEIEGLRWKDFDGNTLQIESSMWQGIRQEPKTEAGKASIPVTKQLRFALEAHRERQGKFGGPEFPIFQSQTHVPMILTNTVVRVIIPALTRCATCRKTESHHKPEGHLFKQDDSLPTWRGWHAFRRGLATNLHASGIDDKTIQAILRHSNVAITQNIYIKTLPESTVEAMDQIGERMENTTKGLIQ